LALGFDNARKNDTDLALCSIHIDNLEHQLVMLTAPSVIVNLPDSKLRLEVSLSIQISVLSDFDISATSDVMWAHVLAFSGGVHT